MNKILGFLTLSEIHRLWVIDCKQTSNEQILTVWQICFHSVSIKTFFKNQLIYFVTHDFHRPRKLQDCPQVIFDNHFPGRRLITTQNNFLGRQLISLTIRHRRWCVRIIARCVKMKKNASCVRIITCQRVYLKNAWKIHVTVRPGTLS